MAHRFTNRCARRKVSGRPILPEVQPEVSDALNCSHRSPSERILQRELNQPRISNHLRDLRQCTIGGHIRRGRVGERRVIEQVEKVCPKAQLLLFAEPKTLPHGKIYVFLRRSNDAIAWRIAVPGSIAVSAGRKWQKRVRRISGWPHPTGDACAWASRARRVRTSEPLVKVAVAAGLAKA